MKHGLLTFLIFIAMSASAQQTNYHFKHTDSTQVSSEKIWRVWVDVPNWKQWDKGLKEAVLLEHVWEFLTVNEVFSDKYLAAA
jgi:hypothetical protein